MQGVERQLRLLQGDAQDGEGIRGIHLQRNVVDVAQKALKANLTALGPLVLPVTELVSPSLPLMPWRDANALRGCPQEEKTLNEDRVCCQDCSRRPSGPI